MHPFRESTVAYSLGIVGFGLPMVLIVLTEFLRWNLLKPSASDKQSVKLFNCDLPSWLIDVYKNFGVFLFGAFVTILATDIGKRTIGRLRPHFMHVCHPVLFDGTNCSNPANFYRYIEDYTCANHASSEEQLRDMKLSFPSGHSSFSMYAMFFAAMYLHFTMTWKGSKLLKYLLQFSFVMMAWFTALSRVSDYKHHCKCQLCLISYLTRCLRFRVRCSRRISPWHLDCILRSLHDDRSPKTKRIIEIAQQSAVNELQHK